MVQKKSQYQTFGQTVGARSFPDATEAELKDLIGTQILIKDAAFKEMQYGEVAILLFEYPPDAPPELNGDFSVLIGGEVVRKKVKEAIEKKLLPLLGTIVHDAVYYDIT